MHGAFTCSHGAKLTHEESFLHVNDSFSAMHMGVLLIRYGSSCLARLSNMLTLAHRLAVSGNIRGWLSITTLEVCHLIIQQPCPPTTPQASYHPLG